MGHRCTGAVLLAVAVAMTISCHPPRGAILPDEGRTIIPGGRYLGMQPPGEEPVLFAPGMVSTGLDQRDTALTPDGTELYWTLWGGGRGAIVRMREVGAAWSGPEIAPFSGTTSDLEPFITQDGRHLFFASKRPLDPGGDEKDWDLWVMDRQGDAWGEPQNLGEPVNTPGGEYYPTLTSDGVLYFTATRADTLGGEDIYRSRPVPGGWSEPENLGPAVNSPGPEFNSLVAPDGSFLIFGSARKGDHGGGDLYISFRGRDGAWQPAVNMGEPINSAALDYCPALSPDGRYFFFTSQRVTAPSPLPTTYEHLVSWLGAPGGGSMSIYWVDAAVIGSLRPR